jgi:D-alanyl-lipoteichoic acid acyltransferase DltB (MBOAT superfamily)
MGSASLQFVAYGAAVAILLNLSASPIWRRLLLLAASLLFLAFFSRNPLAFVPIAVFLLVGYLAVHVNRKASGFIFVASLAILIFLFVWLKRYTFIPAEIFLKYPYFTLGLSYIFFRVLHLVVDSHAHNLADNLSPLSYLNYTLNFTTLVSGPIQPYQEFHAMQTTCPALPMSMSIFGRSAARIITGFYKVNVLSLFLSLIQSDAVNVLLNGESHNRIITGTLIVASYPLYLYCNFSGYIDIVIGMARLLRVELPENFNRPFSSGNFLVFWNRWHITLSTWLKTYVYNPLMIASMEKWPSATAEPFIAVGAFFFTFFLIGVWHGQTSEFIFYGILLGFGVSVVKLYQILMIRKLGRARFNALGKNTFYVAFARGATFSWFTFSLLWFWSSWKQLDAMRSFLSSSDLLGIWVLVFFGMAIVLEIWERVRSWSTARQFEGRPITSSRYLTTVWCTAYVVLTILTMSLLNAPAPDIVYKAF